MPARGQKHILRTLREVRSAYSSASWNEQSHLRVEHEESDNVLKEIKTALQTYGKLNDTEKPLVISGLLLSMRNKGFDVSQLRGKDDPTDGQIIYSLLESPSERLLFIQSRPTLNQIVPRIGKTPLRILAEMLTEEIHDDVLSELYGGDYSRSGDDTGIVLTPPHICELCCELLKLKAGDVLLEPCCGTGRFLVTAMKYVGDKVYGVEVQDDLHAISSANVILHGGVESKVAHGDFFTEDFSGVKFTAGYMNPPYSQKTTELQFTERLLSLLCVGARAAVIVPVSVMIGKTRSDKQVKGELLKHHRLEGVITLNKDTFYGVGTVPCIAIFTAGKPPPPEYEAKFVNFENDGYEVKKHIGLVETDAAKSLKEYLLDSWRGKRTDYRTSFMVKSMVEASDEWLHSFYYYNDDPPTDEKFESSITDYLTFEANMIFHGRGYLFEGGETNADRTDQDTERRGRGATESGQAVEEAPQQYRIVYDV